jgi:hypothetical protein
MSDDGDVLEAAYCQWNILANGNVTLGESILVE